jgi:hypothetical protein
MATTTAHKEQAMNRKQTSIDDLAAAIEWLNAYDRSDDNDEMADALANVVEYLRADIAQRHATSLERRFKADIKRDGKMLTEAGKVTLREMCAEKGAAYADRIVAAVDRGTLTAA